MKLSFDLDRLYASNIQYDIGCPALHYHIAAL